MLTAKEKAEQQSYVFFVAIRIVQNTQRATFAKLVLKESQIVDERVGVFL